MTAAVTWRCMAKIRSTIPASTLQFYDSADDHASGLTAGTSPASVILSPLRLACGRRRKRAPARDTQLTPDLSPRLRCGGAGSAMALIDLPVTLHEETRRGGAAGKAHQ